MKTRISVLAVAMAFIAFTGNAQDISEAQVPSVVLNKFKQTFPKASDVEWEKKGDRYEVDFEIGFSTDHEIIYTAEGEVVRHKEDIGADALPANVQAAVKAEFPDFRMDDTERITESGNVTYSMELKTLREEWKVVYDANGALLSKVAD